MLKVLHISFHKGCQNDIEYLSKKLNFKLDFMSYSDYTVIGNDVYNITHNRALNNWNKNKDYYNSFDIIITSDTAPLSRIFLQNNFQKKLIIWICNRFDYAHQPDATKIGFPDKEYYDLINDVKNKPNVSIIGYTPFETYYANHIRKLDIGNECIKPIGKIGDVYKTYISTKVEDKKNTFIISPYHNENIYMNLYEKLKSLNIKCYNNKYNGPKDLAEFAGVIHLPYAWSNLAFFEALHLDIIYFIPSKKFFMELYKKKCNDHYWFQNSYCFSSSSDMCFDLSFFEIIKKIIFMFIKYLIEKFYINNLKNGKFFWSPPLIEEQLHLSEWYCKDFKDALIYFDSWDDLKHKISNLDFNKQKSILKQLGKKHEEEMLNKWKQYIN